MRILLIDTGVGSYHALDLASEPTVEVDYYIPWFTTFPGSESHLLLNGLVNKVLNPSQGYDVKVVLDVGYYGGKDFDAINYSDTLSTVEVDRIFAKEVFDGLSIPVANYVTITSPSEISKLEELPTNQVVVKSNWRGGFETKVVTKDQAYQLLRSSEQKITPNTPVLVEEKIEGKEIGFDLVVTTTGLSEQLFYGYAAHSHVSKLTTLDRLPVVFRMLLEKLGEFAYQLGYVGMFSAEFIVDKDFNPYLMEIAARFPYITSYLYSYNFSFLNLIKAFTEGFRFTDIGWMIGIPVFARDRFGEKVFDQITDYRLDLESYQVVFNQVYKNEDLYYILEWPSERVGVMYGCGSDLETTTTKMVEVALNNSLPFEIDVEEILESYNFFKVVMEE